MAKMEVKTGYSNNGLPYARFGHGPKTMVIIEGLDFTHRPPSGMMLGMMTRSLKRLGNDFTIYLTLRQPGLPEGYSIRDMAGDYAVMVREELGGPVDIMGVSTGGPIAQYYAYDYPDLTGKLILVSTGYRLTDTGQRLQRQLAVKLYEGKWRSAAAGMADLISTGVMRLMLRSIFWLFGKSAFGSPDSPADGLVELEAEDKHDFKEHLADIKASTLVIGGENDFLYPLRETAEGIPGAQLILYPGAGHGAMMKRRFAEDVLTFLNA